MCCVVTFTCAYVPASGSLPNQAHANSMSHFDNDQLLRDVMDVHSGVQMTQDLMHGPEKAKYEAFLQTVSALARVSART